MRWQFWRILGEVA